MPTINDACETVVRRESRELDEKLYWYADQRRGENQRQILPADARRRISQTSPQSRRKSQRCEKKSVEHHLSHR